MTLENVIVIYLENFDLQTALQQPYIKSLYDTYGKATSYFGVMYPSAPNYLAFDCGETLQNDDTCNLAKYPNTNLADLIEKAGKTWIAYLESAPSNCPGVDSGDYMCHHVGWNYFSDIWNDTTRCESHLLAIASLVNDFPFSKTPPNFVWITPNIVNDGHTPNSPANADKWLSEFLPKILSQGYFTNGSTIIFVVTDTGNPLTNGYTASDGTVINGGQVECIAVSQVSKGKTYTENACHYNLLSSVMDILGLSGTLGKGGTSAFPAMKSLYSSVPPPPPPPPTTGVQYGVVQASNTTDDTFLKQVVSSYGIKWAHDYQDYPRLLLDGFQIFGGLGLPKLGPTSETPEQYAADVKAKMLANPDVHVWGTGDEPDQKLWPGPTYVTYLKAGYEALKATRPNDILIGGTPPSPIQFDGSLAQWNIDWLKSIADAGGAKYMDVVGVDMYFGAGNSQNLSSVLDQIHSFFNLPVAFPEFGSQEAEPKKSQFMQEVFNVTKTKSYMAYMMWYQLIDQPNYPPPKGSYFGLFNINLLPYPAAALYEQLIAPPSPSCTNYLEEALSAIEAGNTAQAIELLLEAIKCLLGKL